MIRKEPQATENQVTRFPPGKVVAPATKGGMHFQRPQGGCKGFIQTGAFYKSKSAHHGSCPLSVSEHNPWHRGPEARWMPYAPLRRRRRPLREYWKAPPRSRSRPRHRRLNPHARQGLSLKAVNPSASRPLSSSFSSTTGTPALTRASASTPLPLIFFPLKVPS